MQKNCLAWPVEFVDDAFGGNGAVAAMLAGAEKVLIVADQNVVQHTAGLGTRIGRYVHDRGISLAGSPVVVPCGEKAKCDGMHTIARVASAMADAGLGGGDAVLAIGGGSLLDVAGYAAAQTRGGVPVVRVPTTPGAMLDAAYATRAAIDTIDEKDVFWLPAKPAGIAIDTSFADTVLDGVWRGGAADAVRFAAARDASLFAHVASLAPAWRERDRDVLDTLARAVAASRTKKKDSSFGLWAAHRLQAMSGYKLPHGYSVAIGVVVDVAYAAAAGAVSESFRDEAVAALADFGAFEGLCHSVRFLQQTDVLLDGVAVWKRSTGAAGVETLCAEGKTVLAEELDRDLAAAAFSFAAAVRN